MLPGCVRCGQAPRTRASGRPEQRCQHVAHLLAANVRCCHLHMHPFRLAGAGALLQGRHATNTAEEAVRGRWKCLRKFRRRISTRWVRRGAGMLPTGSLAALSGQRLSKFRRCAPLPAYPQGSNAWLPTPGADSPACPLPGPALTCMWTWSDSRRRLVNAWSSCSSLLAPAGCRKQRVMSARSCAGLKLPLVAPCTDSRDMAARGRLAFQQGRQGLQLMQRGGEALAAAGPAHLCRPREQLLQAAQVELVSRQRPAVAALLHQPRLCRQAERGRKRCTLAPGLACLPGGALLWPAAWAAAGGLGCSCPTSLHWH